MHSTEDNRTFVRNRSARKCRKCLTCTHTVRDKGRPLFPCQTPNTTFISALSTVCSSHHLACSSAQLGKEPASCQPCDSSKAGEASTIDDQDVPKDMPLEDLVHIEDVTRTTTVATILEVVSHRLDPLGFQGMSLKMAIVQHTSPTPTAPNPAAPVPHAALGCGDEVLASHWNPGGPCVTTSSTARMPLRAQYTTNFPKMSHNLMYRRLVAKLLHEINERPIDRFFFPAIVHRHPVQKLAQCRSLKDDRHHAAIPADAVAVTIRLIARAPQARDWCRR